MLGDRALNRALLERQLLLRRVRRLAGVEPAELATAARELVEAEPRAFGELGKRLAERWPGRDPMALPQTARSLLPLVQIPPRGVWKRSGRALHVTVESWLGRPVGTDAAPDELVLRYLAAFGPAGMADMQNWSFRAEDGRVLHDLPGAPRPDPEVPAPVRFLPQFDNVLLGHADRSRIAPSNAAELGDEQYHWSPLLVDGMLRGCGGWPGSAGGRRCTPGCPG